MPDVRVDHVGVAVESVADAEPLLELLGAEKLVHEADPTGAFRWAYYLLGDASRVELIEPVDGEQSFLTDFLAENGPGMHHVTLEVGDMDAAVAALEADGVRVVDRTDYDAWAEAFVSPRNPTGVLFQLMEYREPFEAGRPDPGRLYIGGKKLSE
ncbi:MULTISPECIES: VOC family protein [Halorussus]|uniref:VOC family protein n=1 Tax=Halorussus TaxID=1070314 RepID=UPI000E21688E|nr:VOC family protein [Halorussus sp. JP-T4]NHN58474.1 VOC family protein [Halorussus sp. JP-T4]